IGDPGNGGGNGSGIDLVAWASKDLEPFARNVLDIGRVTVAQPIGGTGNGPTGAVAAEVVLPAPGHGVLFDIRQEQPRPGAPAAATRCDPGAGGGPDLRAALSFPPGQLGVGVVVIVHGQADLFEVVGAVHAGGRLADLLRRRQEQAKQDGDDGDD